MEAAAPRKLLTLDEAASYIGLSRLTMYEWVSKRKIEYVKVGRLVKFKQHALDAWIEKHTVKSRRDNHGTDKAA